MQAILELQQKRDYEYKSLVVLKDDIKEFIKNPCETVSIDNLKNQYDFILRDIKNLDDKIKMILLSQIQTAKLDLKNLETQLSLVEKPFHVDDLPPYFSIFK